MANLCRVVDSWLVSRVIHLQVVASDHQKEVNVQKYGEELPDDDSRSDSSSKTDEEHDDGQDDEDHREDQVGLNVTAFVLMQANEQDYGECQEQNEEHHRDHKDTQHEGPDSLDVLICFRREILVV